MAAEPQVDTYRRLQARDFLRTPESRREIATLGWNSPVAVARQGMPPAPTFAEVKAYSQGTHDLPLAWARWIQSYLMSF